ncbi:plastocyanin/azurin family copper-binding protein [Salinirubellus salinus]|jgi:plastocyanin|uniref:Plastocyanin/azurin family copper-binding protein n=1 Tax=Salinirubellus salinus TaxID=1364945 RepID=A0A9E7R7C9_9EURY|nr:plastocyanin/azurin family copper-binding protein [Salinirubellus salinus]UWM55988.1 plastocyanin/azurin family copper-binding protein [Salinirubellus salinus]
MRGNDSGERFRSPRRDVLRAVGAGGALAAVGGVRLAQEDDETGDGTDEGTETDGTPDPERAGTVHDVLMLVGPSTNEARPADFYYEPTGLQVQPGDVVRLVAATPDHNLTSYHPAFGMQRRMPVGVGPVATPILGWRPDSIAGDAVEPPGGPEGEPTPTATGTSTPDGTATPGADGDGAGGPSEPVPDTYLVEFVEPGVYDFLCSPHETFGMAMRVVVGDVTEAPFETSDPTALPEPRAGPVGLARGVLTDPELEPAAIVAAGRVSFADLAVNSGGDGENGGTEAPSPGAETETETGTESGG